jgi:hypothetical protein
VVALYWESDLTKKSGRYFEKGSEFQSSLEVNRIDYIGNRSSAELLLIQMRSATDKLSRDANNKSEIHLGGEVARTMKPVYNSNHV